MSMAGQDTSALAVRYFDSAGSQPCLIGRAFLDLPVNPHTYSSVSYLFILYSFSAQFQPSIPPLLFRSAGIQIP